MNATISRRMMLSLAAIPLLRGEEVGNMSGTWWLNLKRSDWNDATTPPTSVKLEIRHNEPKLEYQGEIERGAQPEGTQRFRFSGAIDGKDYAAEQDMGERKIRFTRKSSHVIESYSKFPNGGEERGTTMLSDDGKTLTRRIHFKDREGKDRTWTEIYERKPGL